MVLRVEHHEVGSVAAEADALVAKVTGISFDIDIDTDWPAEVLRSDDGWVLTVDELDDDGYATGESVSRPISLVDALAEAACNCVSNLEVGGLSAKEAFRLLSSPGYIAVGVELARMAPGGDGVLLNGLPSCSQPPWRARHTIWLAPSM